LKYDGKDGAANEEIILMKDREGKVIGFEKLNFASQTAKAVRVAFEALAA
jgi:uncharacterized protein YuzE